MARPGEVERRGIGGDLVQVVIQMTGTGGVLAITAVRAAEVRPRAGRAAAGMGRCVGPGAHGTPPALAVHAAVGEGQRQAAHVQASVPVGRRQLRPVPLVQRAGVEGRAGQCRRHPGAADGPAGPHAVPDHPQGGPAPAPTLLRQRDAPRRVSITELAEFLGHKDEAFTLQVYTHLLPSSHDRARQIMDARMSGPGPSLTVHPRNRGVRGDHFRSCLAITMRWIWLVPS